MNQELDTVCTELLLSFVKVLELRNPFNIDHCKLVAAYSKTLAQEVGLDTESAERLVRAAQVHTIGVLLQMEEKQPDRDLPISRLGGGNGREVSIHQREEQIFRVVVGNIPHFKDCLDVLIQRHEWYDGSGSIHGLSGAQICAEARIMAVVDAYVDLVTPKAHRPAETNQVALERIQELSGTQFDPQYVEALGSVLARESEDGKYNRKFEIAHCRHYLGLGHFYTQIHETEWALRSYAAAERMAHRIGDQGLELGSISGRFLVFCELGQFERAREVLQQVRERGTTSRGKQGYQLLWGLLEWLQGNRLGKEVLARLITEHEKSGNLPGLAAALGFQACMTLFFQGSDDPEHLDMLRRFLQLVDSHDVFDVVERYRPYTIPVFLSAIVHDIESRLARNLLTRMGEPCHGPLLEKLKGIEPSLWTKALMPATHLTAPAAAPDSLPQSAQITIKTLGDLSFESEKGSFGAQVWQTQKTIKLFLMLAFEAGRPVSIDTMSEQLWPDAGPKKARDSFRNCVHQVRKSLKDMLGESSGDMVERSRKNNTVTLAVSCQFDFEQFESLAMSAISSFQASDFVLAARLSTQAYELYRGDFLESFDDEWVDSRRARLRAIRLQVLAVAAKCLLHGGEYVLAERTARTLLELDDLREESHAILIEALGRSGRSAEAVNHYEKAVELFEEEIGVSPDSLQQPLKELGLIL